MQRSACARREATRRIERKEGGGRAETGGHRSRRRRQAIGGGRAIGGRSARSGRAVSFALYLELVERVDDGAVGGGEQRRNATADGADARSVGARTGDRRQQRAWREKLVPRRAIVVGVLAFDEDGGDAGRAQGGRALGEGGAVLDDERRVARGREAAQ